MAVPGQKHSVGKRPAIKRLLSGFGFCVGFFLPGFSRDQKTEGIRPGPRYEAARLTDSVTATDPTL